MAGLPLYTELSSGERIQLNAVLGSYNDCQAAARELTDPVSPQQPQRWWLVNVDYDILPCSEASVPAAGFRCPNIGGWLLSLTGQIQAPTTVNGLRAEINIGLFNAGSTPYFTEAKAASALYVKRLALRVPLEPRPDEEPPSILDRAVDTAADIARDLATGARAAAEGIGSGAQASGQASLGALVLAAIFVGFLIYQGTTK